MEQRFFGLVENGLIAQDYSKGRSWVAIRVPFDPVQVWPQRKAMRVRGTINGFPFRTSLFGSRVAGYLLMVNRTMQKEGHAPPGKTVEIVIEPDLEDRSAAPPPELAKLFRADRGVKKWFEQLSYSSRKYICDAVADAKSPETRKRRAEQWTECMMLAMEGEIEAPPILQAAFRRQPRARTGWDALTPIQRRNHLLSIFMLQGLEARAKRAEKAVVEALRVLHRRTKNADALDELD